LLSVTRRNICSYLFLILVLFKPLSTGSTYLGRGTYMLSDLFYVYKPFAKSTVCSLCTIINRHRQTLHAVSNLPQSRDSIIIQCPTPILWTSRLPTRLRLRPFCCFPLGQPYGIAQWPSIHFDKHRVLQFSPGPIVEFCHAALAAMIWRARSR
jgi:hypothetical protein